MIILLIFIANRSIDVKAKGVSFDRLEPDGIFYQNNDRNKSKLFIPHELKEIFRPQRQASK
jgi:hypothetical protein